MSPAGRITVNSAPADIKKDVAPFEMRLSLATRAEPNVDRFLGLT